MSASLVFFAFLAAIAAWWLAQQKLTAKPWLEVGAEADLPESPYLPPAVAKIGLGIFLAVVGSLFAMLVSAYSMRLSGTDLWDTPVPRLLWLNTGLLVLSSVGVQLAQHGARRGNAADLRNGLFAADIAMLAFLAGQILAWRQLGAAGHLVATSAAASFFYLLTALHGLHVAGGLVALGRTTAKAWSGRTPTELRLSTELCALYSHFLLAVWLVLFAMLMGWTGDLMEMCRQLLS